MERARHTAVTVARRVLTPGLALALAVSGLAPSARAGAYDLWTVDLDAAFPGAADALLIDANASGEAVGNVFDAGGIQRAFLVRFDAGTGEPEVVPIDHAPGGYTRAIALDDAGRVIGISGNHAFVWTEAEGALDLPPLPSAVTDPDYDERLPVAINAAGDIVGWSQSFEEGWRQAVLWRRSGAGMPYVATPIFAEAPWSEARGITDDGLVFGAATFGPSHDMTQIGFVWDANDPGVPIGIENPVPESDWLNPVAINADGQVVGAIADPAGGFVAFTWEGGVTTIVADPGEAFRVTDAGHVLGASGPGGGRFVWLGDPAAPALPVFGLGGALPDFPGFGFASDASGVHALVTGGSWTPTGLLHAYRWSSADGIAVDLFAATCGLASAGVDLHPDGTVVGLYQSLTAPAGGAFVTSPDGLLTLAPPGAASVIPLAIDGDKRVFGAWSAVGAPTRPFIAVPAEDGAAGLPLPAEQPPAAVCQDATVAMGADGSVVFDPAILDGGSISVCALAFGVSEAELDALELGPNLVTLVVSDPIGRSDTCTATVTVIDLIAPMVTCPADVAVTTPSGQSSMAVALGAATATDNAGVSGVTITRDGPTDAVFAVGDHVVTWTATDASGNAATCTQGVAVGDGGGNLFCRAATVTLDAASAGVITVDDVYGGASPGTVFTDLAASPASVGCAELGAVTVTLSGTRADGSAASCQATVTVVDVAPSAVCRPAAVTVSAGSTALDPTWVDGGSIAGCGTVTVAPGTFTLDDVGPRAATVVTTNGDGVTAACEAHVSVLAPGERVWDVIDLDPTGVYDGPGALAALRIDELGRVVGTFTAAGEAIGSRFVWQITGDTPTMTDQGVPVANTVTWDDGTTTEVAPLAGDLELGVYASDPTTRVLVGVSLGWSTVRAVRWAPPSYTPEVLYPNDAHRSEARGVSASGFVYGITRDLTTVRINGAWSWDPSTGATTVLPNPSGLWLEPVAMNASGHLVGTAVAAVGSSSPSRAFVWRPGDADVTLSPDAGSTGWDIDAAGRIAGYTPGAGAFLWDGVAAPTPLGALPSLPTYLTAEPRFAGDLVWGTARGPGFLVFPYLRGADGAIAEPFSETCSVQRAYAYDASANGYLIGPYHAAAAPNRRRGYLGSEGALVGLDLPGALEVLPRQVNESGWVIGDWWLPGDPSVSSHGPQRGFVARPVTSGPLLGTPSVSLAEPPPVAVCTSAVVALDAGGAGVLPAATYLNGGSTGCITTFEASRTTFTAADLGANEVTLTVTDMQGRQASCPATVDVVDRLAPTITSCAPAITVRADPGATTAIVDLEPPTATDNVGVAGFANDAPTAFPLWTTTVRWQAIDTSGNRSGQCTQLVTVIDGGNLVCAATTVQMTSTTAPLDPASLFGGTTGGATFSDLEVDPAKLGCADAGTIRTVTLTGTRDDGAIGSCQIGVPVVDTTYARCRNAVLTLGDDGSAALTPEMVDGGTDGCGAFTLSEETFTEDDLGPNTVTLSYVNASGWESSCQATVYVFGALEAECAPATVSLVDGVGVVSPASLVTTTMDPYIIAATVSPATFGCADIGTQTVTVTVTDALERTTSCTTTVEVGIAAEQVVASDLGEGVMPVARDAQGRLLYNRDGQAWIWDDGVVTQVAPGFAMVEATGMNAHGDVVGTITDEVYESRAFVWTGGSATFLSDPGEPSYGTAINDAGTAVGYVFGAATRAFVWQGGVRTWVEPVPSGATAPVDINEAGQVIGYLDVPVDQGDGTFVPERHAFSWGPITDAGAPTLVDLGVISEGTRLALSEGGQVMLASDFDTLVWRPGDVAPEPIDPTLPTNAFRQSAAGRIVGLDGGGAAFVWYAGDKTPLAGTGGFPLVAALDVNAPGDVVGIELDLDTGAGQVLLWAAGAQAPIVVAPFAFGQLGELGFPRIADDGAVYGIDAATRAWSWRDGALSDLTPPGGTVSVVLGVADGVAWGAWGVGDPTNGFVTRVVSGAPTIVAPATLEAPNALGVCEAVVAIPVTASDACGPAAVTWSGHVEGAPFVVGTTEVVLTATGASGLVTTHTVSVTVEDDEAPVVTLEGGGVVTFDCATPAWIDPGATVGDNCDVGLVASTSGTVDVTTPGAYLLSYGAGDASGNVSPIVTRTVSVLDGDGDETGDCQDGCPADGDKTEPGLCGCGVAEEACADGCPDDPLKTEPGLCGCGVSDADDNDNGVPDCLDVCVAGPVVVSDPGDTTLVADDCVSAGGGGHHGGGCGGGGGHGHKGKKKKSGDKVVAVMPSLVGEIHAIDDCGGAVTVSQDPPAGAELEVGARTLTFYVTGAGGTTVLQRALTVVTGVALDYMSPLENDRTRTFTIGQTVPVKVRLETPCGKDLPPQALVGLSARLEVVELDEHDPAYIRHIDERLPNGQPITAMTRTGNHFHANLATPRSTFTTQRASRYFRVRVTVTSADGVTVLGSADAYMEPRCR